MQVWIQYESCVSYTMFHSQNNIMMFACTFVSIVLGMMHLLQFHIGCICLLPSWCSHAVPSLHPSWKKCSKIKKRGITFKVHTTIQSLCWTIVLHIWCWQYKQNVHMQMLWYFTYLFFTSQYFFPLYSPYPTIRTACATLVLEQWTVSKTPPA